MRKILPFLLVLVLVSAGVLIYQRHSPEAKRFERHEALVKDAKERLDAGEWIGAERDIRGLLKEMPGDTNLQVHLAGILYEQGRYEDCIAWIDGRCTSRIRGISVWSSKAKWSAPTWWRLCPCWRPLTIPSRACSTFTLKIKFIWCCTAPRNIRAWASIRTGPPRFLTESWECP